MPPVPITSFPHCSWRDQHPKVHGWLRPCYISGHRLRPAKVLTWPVTKSGPAGKSLGLCVLLVWQTEKAGPGSAVGGPPGPPVQTELTPERPRQFQPSSCAFKYSQTFPSYFRCVLCFSHTGFCPVTVELPY